MSASKTPVISVIMNCYNSERYLKEAIDSVYAQTYTNWEGITNKRLLKRMKF